MICWHLKFDEEMSRLQQSVLLFAEHREHLTFFIVMIFTLLYSILLLPISSSKFLLGLKAATVHFEKSL